LLRSLEALHPERDSLGVKFFHTKIEKALAKGFINRKLKE
jgi:hypothetical protein